MQYIVVLERTGTPPMRVRYLLRATVPTDRQPFLADAEKMSAYPQTPAADLADLRAGKVVEFVSEMDLPGLTVPQVKTALLAAQAAFQARVTADAEYNPWKFYGTFWDGTAWTTGGVN